MSHLDIVVHRTPSSIVFCAPSSGSAFFRLSRFDRENASNNPTLLRVNLTLTLTLVITTSHAALWPHCRSARTKEYRTGAPHNPLTIESSGSKISQLGSVPHSMRAKLRSRSLMPILSAVARRIMLCGGGGAPRLGFGRLARRPEGKRAMRSTSRSRSPRSRLRSGAAPSVGKGRAGGGEGRAGASGAGGQAKAKQAGAPIIP